MTAAIRRIGYAVIPIIVICLVVVPSGSADASTIESVADCRELVRQHPNALEAYRCYWMIARQRNLWEPAIGGLEAILVDDPGQPRALLYLGMISSDRGEPRAEKLLMRAADGFATEAEVTGEVYSRLGLAYWLDRRDRIDDSRIERRRALEVASASDDQVLAARVRLAQAWQATRDHDYATARSLFLEVEPVVFPDGPFDVRVGVVNGLGYADWATGRYRSAMTNYRRQAALCAQEGDVFQETGALYNAAIMAAHLAQTPADLERIDTAAREALDAAIRTGDRELEARLRLMLAEPHDGSNVRRTEASKALTAARAAAIPELEFQAMRGLAVHDLAAQKGASTDAVERIREAVERARTIGNLHEEIVGRITLAWALWSHGDRDNGLSESLVALDLVDELRTLQTADEERARIASTWSHAFYQPIGRLLETGDPGDRELALQIMERLRAHGLVDLLEAADAPAPESIDAAALSVRAVQAALADDEILASYQLADRFDLQGRPQGGSWLILITRRSITAHSLPDRREIEAAVDVYLGLVRRGDNREAEAAHRLFELVLAPTFESLTEGVASLVVVPDGVLAGLPFAALRPEPGGPPLVDRLVVSLAPSVSRWLRQRAPPETETRSGCLGIADPELADGVADRQPLPYARTEVRRACRLIGGASRAVTGASATEVAVKEMLLKPFDVVHFATHAEVDRADPSHTAILLGAGDSTQDGRLHIAEISSLQLRQPMVVLSACQSAGGVVLQGEGVLGLTRAFFEGGARTVVGNLWPVDDREAAVLVDHFYRHLTAGLSVADALAQAQRERWVAGDSTVAWASLVVLGDGYFELTPDPRRPRLWLAVIVAVAAMGLFVVVRIVRFRAS
ncbi:MAG: CHAT domain-containing protein [Thermoanaerobaculales bacterium]|nr:CHAT domain-containing protein [Thermoanaerobaculales bacterium]